MPFFFFLTRRLPPRSTLFPYTTLFRSTAQETFIPANVLITVIPVSILIYFLFGGSSAARAGFYATVACLVLYIFKDLKPASIKDRVLDIGNMFIEAGTGLIMIAILAGTAQIIVGLLSITGLGIKLSNVLLSVGDGSVIITLVLAMLICIILGMGMPTTAAYLLASSTLASTLVTLGHEPLASHLFLFYFAVVSAITPPVCVAVFVACGISQGNWIKTAKTSMLIGFPAFIVPYIFINNQSLLLQGTTATVALNVLTASVGIFVMSGGLMGSFFKKLNALERTLIVVGGFLLLLPDNLTNYIGLALLLLFIIANIKNWKSRKQ